jgi:septal ring factor EnvC (AmiA/AmiB activator)
MNLKIDPKELSAKVSSLLKFVPETRDNDRYLVSEIWSQETEAETVNEFLIEIEDGKLSHFETITRIRRRLQEEDEDLRGETYEQRQHYANNYYHNLNF